MSVQIRPRAFAVWFKDLARWNPGSFVDSAFHWPQDYIKPLSSVLARKCAEAKKGEESFARLPLVTIRFDGEMEPRGGKGTSGIKGKLFLASAGDVVFSKIDVRNGAIGIVPDTLPVVAVTSEFPVYEVKKDAALPLYIKLLFRTQFFRRTINSMISGASGRKRVQPEQLVDVEVPLPPLHVQRGIVEQWQKAQGEISIAQGVSAKAEMGAAVAFLQGIGLSSPTALASQRAFAVRWHELDRWGVEVNRPSRRLDVTASCFGVCALGDVIADLENGWSPQCLNRVAQDGEWGVLKVGAVSFGTFAGNQNKALPPSLKPIQRYEVREGDLIVSRANIARYVGACALVRETRPKLMLCDKLFRVIWRQDSKILPEYLDEVMKTPHVRAQIENALTGTSPTMKNISKPSLLALRFPLPPLEVQKDLVETVRKMRSTAAVARSEAAGSLSAAISKVESLILGIEKVE